MTWHDPNDPEPRHENLDRLLHCPSPHVFALIPESAHGGSHWKRRYRCTKCGGEVDNRNRGFYLRGQLDAVRAMRAGKHDELVAALDAAGGSR